ncbi:UDP-N-acetylmuramate--L-alanine ligase [Actinomyces urogenitalis DSM 15434]|uniref:UDP-N-acetylmuramate--L-alanine ligase n=1 Tax=Actinomyces urogenitalis DSM 15434 TaxID=525246 RepID=C0W7G2_9ACTO|nr:UDP-N-acetylmuramate--L-alanine ligase [Actinomyces urogenitalis]EEH65343.1 UDP-N-acetylmuramate--L-alanine ligase [Actinomyces urogenitalis DSM 15434]MBS6072476.1 UDP-N-acetylmuramate--L-alanine ligase [Actinomyces urogenitalis]MDK8236961.1 UDP-N-acetylmuramate--L-alanine ligase [Actinomyces urogenitalis]MDK8834197.1 UDP-N-acetylmuramate--L-alanine ligase [Actinomyces urogenitalis]MDU5426692.1 UDP-N-acetylmuramate--L-alanine ligase [Actinomyces urogenitalis]
MTTQHDHTTADLAGSSFHLIGVGGAGMSVLAQLLAEQGAHVTGSDAHSSPALEQLLAQGLEVRVGHDADAVPPEATVVVSTAIKETNPELVRARGRGQEVIHRSQALALAARGRSMVAVAGAHGKTTTSGMLAEALTELGWDPSFAIGGVVRALGSGAHLGAGQVLVAEADESDRSFLNYAPAVEIVTNVEPDHLDTYGTREAFEEAFLDFSRRLIAGGLLIACAQDPGALRLARAAAGEGRRVVTYGSLSPAELPDQDLVGLAHVELEVEEHPAQGTRSRLTLWTTPTSHDEPVSLELSVPGEHVALDAAAAWACGVELGAQPQAMARALGAFGGTKRRFEDRGEVGGVRVVDDYAHHPTEIQALATAAREVAQARGGRLLILFQPHLFSRTQAFAERFGQALSLADLVVVTAVYPAREAQEDFPGVSGRTVSEHVPGGRYLADRVEAARSLADAAQRGDLLLTVGAGDVTEMGQVILDRLAERGLDGPGGEAA